MSNLSMSAGQRRRLDLGRGSGSGSDDSASSSLSAARGRRSGAGVSSSSSSSALVCAAMCYILCGIGMTAAWYAWAAREGPVDTGKLRLAALWSSVFALALALACLALCWEKWRHGAILKCWRRWGMARWGRWGRRYEAVPAEDARFGPSAAEKRRFVVKRAVAAREMRGDLMGDAIVDAFVSVENAEELAQMKKEVDSELREVGLSLYWLVFRQLPQKCREAFLEHGVRVLADARVERVFVISDMDDTLVSTFKDRRFPWNTLYPGVRRFYHELIKSCPDAPRANGARYESWKQAKEQVTFVTARPSWLQSWTRNELVRHGFETSVALTGSSTSFITPASMLARKVKQCKQMRDLFPEGIFYLIGDNGQRDIDLGKELLRLGLVRAVFIHDIFEPLSYGQPLVSNPRHHNISKTCPPAEQKDGDEESPLGQQMSKSQWLEQPMHHLNSEASLEARALMLDQDGVLSDRIGMVQHELDRSHLHKGHLTEDSFVVNILPSLPQGYRHDECRNHGIVLFQSFVGAAFAASEMGLFENGTKSLLAVATSSADDFSKIPFATEMARQKQREVFLRDLARVTHAFTRENERLHLLKTVHDQLQ